MKIKKKTDLDGAGVSGAVDRKLYLILLIIYIAFLFGFCVVFRKPQEALPRPGLFRSYRAAWRGGHLFPFAQNILLNMLLFTPVGLLFCGSMIKAKGGEKTAGFEKGVSGTYENRTETAYLLILFAGVLLGFAVSMAIERLQLHFHRGTYETDDVINNTFGSLLGGSWMIMIKHRKWRYKLIWITWVFFLVGLILLSRMVWLRYLH